MTLRVDNPIRMASMRAGVLAADPEHMLYPRDVALARLSDALLAHLDAMASLSVCEHAAEWLQAGAPLFWSPELVPLVCLPCLLDATNQLEQDAPNNRCDTCDRPPRSYRLQTVIAAVGPVAVYALRCRRCRPLQQDPPYDAVSAGVRVTAHLEQLLGQSPGPEAA